MDLFFSRTSFEADNGKIFRFGYTISVERNPCVHPSFFLCLGLTKGDLADLWDEIGMGHWTLLFTSNLMMFGITISFSMMKRKLVRRG